MAEEMEPWLEPPSEENGWVWRCHGLGMVWDHPQEWQARWKLHYLQTASGHGDRHDDQSLPTADR